VIVVDDDPIKVEFPGADRGPLRHILVRIALAFGLVTFVALLTYIGRHGYLDPEDRRASRRRCSSRPPGSSSSSCSSGRLLRSLLSAVATPTAARAGSEP
jgi:hypothetical protein